MTPDRARPAFLAALALAALTAVAACGSGSAGSGGDPADAQAAQTTVSISQATQLVNSYSVVNNLVNRSYSAVRDQTIEEPPASVASTAGLGISRTEGKLIPQTQYFGSTFVVPRISGYPRLVLAVSHMRSDGTTVPYTLYILFVQDAARAPWRVAYYPFSTGQVPVPAPAAAANDSAPAVTTSTGLLVDPATINAALYAHATGQRGASTSPVPLAPTPELDQQLTDGYTSGVAGYNAAGVSVYQTLLPTPYPVYLIRTKDGGALAFTADEVRDMLVPTHPGGTVQLPAGSSESVLAGKPNGTIGLRYSVVRLQMFMSYIPPQGNPGGGVQLLSYADYPISVSSR